MSEYFDRVTGTNDYERQSWRDSYNGGRAAGDLTGNVNARLDAERASFGGATWSGSSSQYSALELARQQSSPSGLPGSGAPAVGSGPGNAAVNPRGGGSGPGSAGIVSGPLTEKLEGGATRLLLGGDWMRPSTWFSDANEWENRYAEPGEWLGGLVVMGADAVFNTARAVDWGFGTDMVSNKRPDKPALTDFVDRQLAGPGAWSGMSNWWNEANSPFGPDHPIAGYGAGGF